MLRRPVSVTELGGFKRRADELLSEAEQDALIDVIAYDPTCGVVVPGTGGLRKLRVAAGGSGKRGGARVIYYFYNEDIPLLLMAIFAKNEKADLSERQKKASARYAEGVRQAMAKKVRSRKKKPSVADDILASWEEALRWARGEKTGAIVHTVIPSDTDAREARHKLGLSQREFAEVIGTGVGTVRKWEVGTRRPSGAARTLIEVIKREPKAVARALKGQKAS